MGAKSVISTLEGTGMQIANSGILKDHTHIWKESSAVESLVLRGYQVRRRNKKNPPDLVLASASCS